MAHGKSKPGRPPKPRTQLVHDKSWSSRIRKTQTSVPESLTVPTRRSARLRILRDSRKFECPHLPTQNTERYIRIIRLNTSLDPTISCSLNVYRLDNAPPFFALSYCWGTEEPNDHDWILCNDAKIKVKPNLYAALCQLRKTEYTTIWIDAICIDQANVRERNHQVNLMGDIYRTAQMTVVWLGPAQCHQERVVDYVRLLSKAYRTHPIHFSDLSWSCNLFTADLANVGLPSWKNAHEPLLEPLKDFFTAPWFSRAWVVQEVALAKDVVLLQGNESFPWYELHAAKKALRAVNGWLFYDQIQSSHRFDVLYYARYSVTSGTGTILEHLSLSNGAICLDSRDKIFSMLGIARSLQGAELVGSAMEPDYGATTESVYFKFASSAIYLSDGLKILCSLRMSDLEEKLLPSWVPDFSSRRQVSRLSVDWDRRGDWQASGGAKADCKVQDRSLRLSGYVIDKIAAVSDFLVDAWSLGSESEFLEITPQAAIRILAVEKSRLAVCSRHGDYSMGGTASDAYWRLFFPIKWVDKLKRVKIHAEDKLLKLAREAQQTTANKKRIASTRLPEWCTLRYIIQAWHLADGIKFARTEQGYYSKVPWNTDVGDSIILCAGSRVPLVSRPIKESRDSRHQMIGGCYVDGIMEGQAWRPELAEYMWFD